MPSLRFHAEGKGPLVNEFFTALDTVTEVCEKYEQVFGTSVSTLLSDQLREDDDIWERDNPDGHLTGSAIVLSDQAEVLLVKHKVLGLWLAPGGHADLFEMPARTAARELAEETGLSGLELHPWHLASGIPIDIDTHAIPENAARGEAAHFHHDFRYIFTVASSGASRLRARQSEVDAIGWKFLDSLKTEYPRVHQRLHALPLA